MWTHGSYQTAQLSEGHSTSLLHVTLHIQAKAILQGARGAFAAKSPGVTINGGNSSRKTEYQIEIEVRDREAEGKGSSVLKAAFLATSLSLPQTSISKEP
jgi:hypothetical protein